MFPTTTIFITRYVADHEAAIQWYTDFFGEAASGVPVPNCREWEPRPGVIFQVIEQPDQAGSTTFTFGVEDLAGVRTRLAETSLTEETSWQVKGFDALTYTEYADPEGVRTGLLNISPR
ncbi:VOC family protein [Parenemella sanctibonifatiensis]|uniref:VOC family protein n=1 Tax=Parenemella sanctibonifatiensis TaxID=2016505 RepID=A0A255ET53_9ACTN|nr:VOC family protein [Parenemella sanctibonifatiensis]OYN92602.1 hypothetical protein CGZ91_03760 [Parenemella sanctibonifatiensis]